MASIFQRYLPIFDLEKATESTWSLKLEDSEYLCQLGLSEKALCVTLRHLVRVQFVASAALASSVGDLALLIERPSKDSLRSSQGLSEILE